MRLQNKVRCTCMPSCTVLLPSLNKIWPLISEKWLGTHLGKKMATSWPSWIWSPNIMTSLCKPSFFICLPSLNKIGKCMSEKWLRTCSIPGFILHLKWLPVSHLWPHHETKWYAYAYYHVLSLCQVQIKSVHTCPRYSCGPTHAHMKNETKSTAPPFRTKSNGGL